MKLKNNVFFLFWGISILLISFNIVIILVLKQRQSIEITDQSEKQDTIIKAWFENMRLSSQINDDLNFDSKTSFLFYRYSSHMCRSCILEDLNELSKYQEKIGNDKILIFPAYEDTREEIISVKNDLIEFNFRNISKDSLTIPIDQEGTQRRYFAFVDDSGKISMVFFPIRGRTVLTQSYFSEVHKLLNWNY
jgi:hypothetical protein